MLYNTPGLYNPPINEEYSEMEATISHELMKHVIGYKGQHFIRITNSSNVKYIWYDSDRNVIEIWGSSIYHSLAKSLIKEQIDLIQIEFKSSFEKQSYMDTNKDTFLTKTFKQEKDIEPENTNFVDYYNNIPVCDTWEDKDDYFINDYDVGYDSY